MNEILTRQHADLITPPSMKEWDNTEFDCRVEFCVENAQLAIDWHKKTNCRVDIKINHSRIKTASYTDPEIGEVWQMTVLHGKGEAGLLEIGSINENRIINWLIRVHKYEGII